MPLDPPAAAPLPPLRADLSQCTVSGLSSGAFMSVQLHLAHSSMFVGAGIVAGGPYRCAESYRAAAPIAADAYVQNALFVCMNPLTPQTAPNAARLVALARETAEAGLIDPVSQLARQKLYIFTGTKDAVVHPVVVERTRDFYLGLGVPADNLLFVSDVPAGHALLTTNLEDNALGQNQPPYLNRLDAGPPQSWTILRHLLGPLKPPVEPPKALSGRVLRFDQREFFGGQSRASMSAYGYAYVPRAVAEGAPCRVHVALHGCKQGANYVNFVNGRPDRSNNPPYGSRYITSTGYNEIADSNNLVVLYPQAEGTDDGQTQNPEGCWDWWGYSSPDPLRPDYYAKQAIQISAIHGMLNRLGGR